MPELFTIGHSTHSLEDFVKLLRQHRIEAVADVRSSPFSARLPQFNRDVLTRALREQGIAYVFLGEELGLAGRKRNVTWMEWRVMKRLPKLLRSRTDWIVLRRGAGGSGSP